MSTLRNLFLITAAFVVGLWPTRPQVQPTKAESPFVTPASQAPAAVEQPCAVVQAVRWHSDYGEASREAIGQNKPLLIVVGTDDCVPCKALAKTLSTEDVEKALANVVCFRSHAAAEAKRFNVDRFPEIIIYADGELRVQRAGIQTAAQVIADVRSACAPVSLAGSARKRPRQPVADAAGLFHMRGLRSSSMRGGPVLPELQRTMPYLRLVAWDRRPGRDLVSDHARGPGLFVRRYAASCGH